MRRRSASLLSSLPKRKADFIEPMDCAPVPKLIDGPGWVYEIKLDGYRAVAVKSDGGVNLFSRRHKLFNHQYPYLVEALNELPEGTVVDGEVVALDESGRQTSISSKALAVRHVFTTSSSIFSFATTATSPDCP